MVARGETVVRARWRIRRTMLVPAQWNGSVEHFYHFFFGYFLPVVLYQERSGDTSFTLRDCGPMNPWFDLLRPGTDLEFMQPGVMLHRVVTNRQERVMLRGWDDPTRFHSASLRAFATVLSERAGGPDAATSSPRVTVLERRTSPTFYTSTSSEVFSSGTDFRSWPNTDEAVDAIQGRGEIQVVDTAAMPPVEQVQLFAATEVLLAQHGAGLSNMVFMKPGTTVIEIKPPLESVISTIYSNLASAMGLGYLSVEQENEHAPVPASTIRATVDAALSNLGQPVPTMTGSLPMRLLRQLPRRL